MLVKLQNAIEQVDDKNGLAGKNALKSFVNEVKDDINKGILTPALGQLLIDMADEVIALF